MILFDLNQVMISNIMKQVKKDMANLDENLVRHMVLNSIRSYNRQFREVYGKMILCCDNGKSWRKSVYPQYKASRRKDYDKSIYDWNKIYELINMIKEEIKEEIGYRTIEINGVEADDIIGVLAPLIVEERNEPVLIISGDKDFLQLQETVGIDQFSPTLKNFMVADDPKGYLLEHTLKGDAVDGIPNFLSPDDCLVNQKRQKNLYRELISEILEQDDPVRYIVQKYGEDSDEKMNFERNQKLIDLKNTPFELIDKILEEYRKPITHKSKTHVLSYLAKHKLKELTNKIEDF